MLKFAKSNLTVDGNNVHLSLPFAKVDVDKRTVSGYATLDNIDSQNDVVTAEASRKAFARARGNLREMHDKIAVGRIVDFREDEFFDSEANNGEGAFYRGIFVTARISEGAENTWLKVLDGTLSGFSIGGEITDASSDFVKEVGRTVRFIKDYDLVELSLVDNPANQLANIFSIQKSATGSVNVEGMVAETVIENVFYCKQDATVIVKATELQTCPECGTEMENAGWFESDSDKAQKVRRILDKYLSPPAPTSEGGVEMAKKDEEKVVETPDAVDATQEDALEEADREPKEVVVEEDEPEAVEVEEVEDDSANLEKKFDEFTESVRSILNDNKNETLSKVDELERRITEVHESLEKKASELDEKYGEFGEKLATAKARIEEFQKALDDVNSADAVRKSAELDSGEAVQKSNTFRWGKGTFSGDALFR
jgi:hypothetical protein